MPQRTYRNIAGNRGSCLSQIKIRRQAGTRQPLDALTYLNQIRALYNEGRYADARDVAAAAESALAGNGGMEGVLGEISAALTDQERENYDPLEAYHSLTEWLN